MLKIGGNYIQLNKGEKMTENKAEIVKAFLPVLQMTEYFNDLIDLEYQIKTDGKFKRETVIATFTNGSIKKANVNYDSGFAVLKDILNQLE